MSMYLGIDTSNYTTSVCLYDSDSGEVISKRKLLPVKDGELGLRQSDAVFHHVQQLPALFEEAFGGFSDQIKAIGVSNFFPAILANFCENVEIIPAVNQVELHPWFAQEDALKVMDRYGVVPQAWASLAEGKHGIFTDPDLTAIGKKYGKSAAQVALRWNVQRGVVVNAKSTKPERIRQNLDVFDFQLTDEEMKKISSKTLDHSEIINHFDSELVIFLNNRKIHN